MSLLFSTILYRYLFWDGGVGSKTLEKVTQLPYLIEISILRKTLVFA